jgi:hypothetical protein
MAKIIYKEGCEGQNRLESIEGIEIELLNGQKALIYPKYAERMMLETARIANCDLEAESEIKALKREENTYATNSFSILGSPAAKFVHQFTAVDRFLFGLPTLLAAMEIQDQKKAIDELAETIEGADLLRNFTHDVWTCSRYNDVLGWMAVGSFGFADKEYSFASALAVPTILYRETK